MTQSAHPVSERIWAKNAVKIRAALAVSVDADEVVKHYLMTHPVTTDNPTQDRVRARAWAVHNVKVNNAPLKAALSRLYRESYSFGQANAEDYVFTHIRRKSVEIGAIDWSTWNPGNPEASRLIGAPNGLQSLLGNIQITSLNMEKSSYDLLGSRLADGLAIGAAPSTIATMIKNQLSTPERALMIARTEGSRASNAASQELYQSMGITQHEWSAVDPVGCACVELDGEIVDIGEVFPSSDEGVTQPPEHPNCVCTTLPVLPDSLTLDTVQNTLSDAQNNYSDYLLGGAIGASDSQDDGEGDTYITDQPSVTVTKPLQSNPKRR